MFKLAVIIFKKFVITLGALGLLAVCIPQSSVLQAKELIRPKNIIIFVADGMGFAHLSLARAMNNNTSRKPAWDRFTAFGWHHPHPIGSYLTDSAASATAFATGVDTRNGAIGVDADGKPVTNLYEIADQHGYRTGIVTDSFIWDATPAAFVTHADNRSDATNILNQLAASKLEVLFGELENAGKGGVPSWDNTVKLLEERFTMLGADLGNQQQMKGSNTHSSKPIAAIFKIGQIKDLQSNPTLGKMTEKALKHLSSDKRPFLLLVESEEPDSASHGNNTKRLIRGMASIEYSLNLILDFIEKNNNTLVIFLSDHETGGLVLGSKGSNKKIKPLWVTNGHSGTAVPIMAFGLGSEYFSGIHTNEGVGLLLKSMIK